MEMTKQFREELNAAALNEISRELLVQGILSSCEKALLMLQWSGSTAQPQSPTPITGSPQTEEFNRGAVDYQEQKKSSKKRKMMPVWTEQLTLNSENGLEGPHDDGHSRRKYGQKDILRAKFSRSYYRCTYRSTQNCWATKQVQRSDESPTVFEIAYRGKHTCSESSQANPLSPSTEKKEQKQNDDILLLQQFHKESGPGFCLPSSPLGWEEIGSNDISLHVSTISLSSAAFLSHSPCRTRMNQALDFNPARNSSIWGLKRFRDRNLI